MDTFPRRWLASKSDENLLAMIAPTSRSPVSAQARKRAHAKLRQRASDARSA